MTTETIERLKRAAAARPNGNASNVRAADLTALIEKVADYQKMLTMLAEVAGAPIPAASPMDWDTLEMVAWCRARANTNADRRATS